MYISSRWSWYRFRPWFPLSRAGRVVCVVAAACLAALLLVCWSPTVATGTTGPTASADQGCGSTR